MHDETLYDEKFVKRMTQLRMEKGVSARDMSLSIGQNPGYINLSLIHISEPTRPY